MAVAVPSAVKVFNWTATLYKSSVSFQTPMLYAFGFIGLFTIGGLTGVMLGTLGINMHVHDTYFVVAHFHYVMVGGTLMGYLGGLHYWWPKLSGRLYNAFWSKIAALVIFIGFNLTFFPQFLLGYLGMPRRYHVYPPEWQVLNVMSSAGATPVRIAFSSAATTRAVVASRRRASSPRCRPMIATAGTSRRHAIHQLGCDGNNRSAKTIAATAAGTAMAGTARRPRQSVHERPSSTAETCMIWPRRP